MTLTSDTSSTSRSSRPAKMWTWNLETNQRSRQETSWETNKVLFTFWEYKSPCVWPAGLEGRSIPLKDSSFGSWAGFKGAYIIGHCSLYLAAVCPASFLKMSRGILVSNQFLFQFSDDVKRGTSRLFPRFRFRRFQMTTFLAFMLFWFRVTIRLHFCGNTRVPQVMFAWFCVSSFAVPPGKVRLGRDSS